MTSTPFAAVLAIGIAFAGAAMAQPPAPTQAAAPAKFGPDSTFRDLVANPGSKALLYAQIPLIMQTLDAGLFEDSALLKQVAENEQAQSAGGFTPEVYQKLLKDLAAL